MKQHAAAKASATQDTEDLHATASATQDPEDLHATASATQDPEDLHAAEALLHMACINVPPAISPSISNSIATQVGCTQVLPKKSIQTL